MDPKPIALTQVDADDYEGFDPQHFVVVGDMPGSDPVDVVSLLESLPGYDAGATQTLTNSAGTLEWVTGE